MDAAFEAISLAGALARSGVIGRRGADAAVRAGKVAVNGTVELDPARKLSACDVVCFDGAPLPSSPRRIVCLLNKPEGWICSRADRFSEHLAWKLLPDIPGVRWFSAGRLDAASRGMIVFTNDGALVHFLESPESRIAKYYHVETARPLSAPALERVRRGMVLPSGDFLRPDSVRECEDGGYEFILTEGRRHEIRRLIQFAGTTVRGLERTRIGDLEMGGLPPGAYRELTETEIAALKTVVRHG